MRVLLISILLFSITGVLAQDTLSGVYSKLNLEAKVYVVTGTVSIEKQLFINSGARVFFSDGASIVVNGSLNVNGISNLPVLFKSVPGQKGSGFVIRNNSDDSISIQGAHFENLILPLLFDKDWSRNDIIINKCEFVANKSANSVIYVQRPKYLFNRNNSSVVKFLLNQNLFAENESPLYFEDFSNDILQFTIKENAFVENNLFDYGAYNFSSNILFGRADKFSSLNKLVLINNSFVDNKLINSTVDTLSQFANFGIYGTEDSINIVENYWGSSNENNVKGSIYDYSINYTSPRVQLRPLLSKPSPATPPHIYSVVKNLVDTLKTDSSSNILNSLNFKLMESNLSQFILLCNKPVNFSGTTLTWVYLSDSTSQFEKKLDFNWGSSLQSSFGYIKLDAVTTGLISSKIGYLKVDGIVGVLGEYIPTIKIGLNNFLKERFIKMDLINKQNSNKIDSNSAIKPALLITTYKFNKKSEVGIIGMFGWYYGTLSNRKLFKNDVNAGFGVQYRRSFGKFISVSVSTYKISLSGSDLRSNDTAKIARGMSFKSPIMGAILSMHYSLKNNLVYSSKTRFIPEISLGVEYLKFNPQGIYKGVWYDLQPLGTAGQTSSGSELAPYSLSSIGVPISFIARLILNKHTTFNCFAQYHFLMTNYLDDVGSDLYVSPTKILAANPTNPEAAVYFSNPSYRNIQTGQLRSAISDANDGFFTIGINLSYHF